MSRSSGVQEKEIAVRGPDLSLLIRKRVGTLGREKELFKPTESFCNRNI